MDNKFTRNDRLFFMLNIIIFIALLLLTVVKEFSFINLLAIFILLVNVVCSLAIFNMTKKAKGSVMNMLRVIFSIALNLSSYALLLYSFSTMFGR